jgi:membrane protein implicated in regulation of membrane protease activity
MADSRFRLTAVALTLAAMAVPAQAFAYIGPGLGAGAIGAVLGVLGSIFLGLFAILWYPVKRLMKKRKKGGPGDGAQ